jgi:hypothetical protein
VSVNLTDVMACGDTDRMCNEVSPLPSGHLLTRNGYGCPVCCRPFVEGDEVSFPPDEFVVHKSCAEAA